MGGGVGVRAGKRGLGVCTIKAPSELLGVKGMIMHTNGGAEGGRDRICESDMKNKREKNKWTW